ncbi:uncharacterized protein N7482_004077 [Penicillium canariense]|uniref:Uncharacterized protein n=1 Tax=Penicillium canariense TaxID=189055 RepID=A0A9W9I7Y5_9EURO|nr:uncharacterized protein N7482_004077 [Penicillium canariense]KAJ5168483.1 hypothetical protein N7482_004077 [Penicillium canariense]
MRHLRLHNGLAASDLSLKFIHSINLRRCFSHSRVNHDLTPFTRRLFKIPSAPSPPSQHHNNLTTFLSYAERISLPSTSTVYIGTHYEYTVLQSLRRYALALHRIGGRDDAGIDLLGTWHLPERERERALRVLVQCKALKTKLGPNLVRELEGTFRQAPVGWRTGQTVGILVSPREATKGVRDALARSSYPLFWMMVERDGTLKQALWNARAEELGLGPLGVDTRYGTGVADSESGSLTKEVTLTWDGCDIPDMEQVEQGLLHYEGQWVKSWGEDLPGVEKEALLEIVETIFPDGQPEAGPDGVVPDVDRVKILQALRE